jgi:two-component system cell cycle sensor histidine kinase PleC
MGFCTVEDGQQLRVRPGTDLRILTSQLDVMCSVVHSSRFLAPVWCGAIALFASDGFGYLGHTSFRKAMAAPAIIGLAMLFSVQFIASYRRSMALKPPIEKMQAWFGRFVALQMAISVAWGLGPWLLWDPASPSNHVFIWASVVCVIASFVVNRANNMSMLVGSVVPIVLLTLVRFLLSGAAFDVGLAALLPFCAMLLVVDARRITMRSGEEALLRFEVEDLARELEEARDEALRKRFEAETANASKTAFLANMSHELRTPLNAILGFSEIISQECFGPAGSPRYAEYAGDIHASGSHLLSLINDLLDIAKIEAGRMEIEPHELDARHAFEAALKIIGAKARERGQELAIEVDASAPPLVADERALKQILINLAANAVKFTQEGGRISVLGSLAACGGFQISVVDNGPGIPRDKLDRIFQPFSQVDNRYDRQGGGTGLGLALVRGLAELHGGRSWIESEEGHGCRAYVVLPAPAKGASASRKHGEAAVAALA